MTWSVSTAFRSNNQEIDMNRSSHTAMGLVLPFIHAVSVRELECDDYYESLVVEEVFL